MSPVRAVPLNVAAMFVVAASHNLHYQNVLDLEKYIRSVLWEFCDKK